MADIYSQTKRSEIMSRVRGYGNRSSEHRLIGIFKAASITGWRRKQPLFGRPDFIFPKQRLAVFVDGCFWHGCPVHASCPSTNRAFWKLKLSRNKDRDRLVTRVLRSRGWRVLRIWHHQLSRKNETRCALLISRALG